MSSIPILNFEQTMAAVQSAFESKITLALMGPPGVGKTQLVRLAAKVVKKPLHVLLGSTCDPSDIGGIPVVTDGELRRIPIAAIRACAAAPGILFLDEITTVTPSVQAPLMRLLLEGVAGDVKLHKESVVCAAFNPPEHCPGSYELSAATTNRMIIVKLSPTLSEIRAFFDNLGEEDTPLRAEGRDWSATVSQETRLLQIDPPPASVQQGEPWGSPRAWERGLIAYVQAVENKAPDVVSHALLAGAVGEAQATVYAAIKRLRDALPSVDDIRRDPEGTRVPDGKDKQIAAIGVLSRVADVDIWAAWMYAERLGAEISMACARVLLTRPTKGPGTFATKGRQAQIRLMAKISRKIDAR